MIILGIETSCDETAAAVVKDGTELLSNVVQSQIDIHKAFGGVVPEVAARSHIEVMLPVVDEALKQAKMSWDDIDGIGVTYAPGLIGSLLIGTLTARTLAVLKNKPLYPVHHVEGHVYANFINPTPVPSSKPPTPNFPLLALIVSGGHSQLVLFKDHDDYKLLGQTLDDAVGEAFDKVAKVIGLPYPGGPSIEKAAVSGNPKAYRLPKAKVDGYNFSFSGLKTAVLRQTQAICGKSHDFPSGQLAGLLVGSQQADIAASFQHIAIETLVDKTIKAYDEFKPASIVIAGGVAASSELRRQLKDRLPIDITYPDPSLCTDNAAMIASLAYFVAKKHPATDPFELEAIPNLSM